MRRCLELAADGLGSTYPNPLVGCVIVEGNRIIGEGSHRVAGGPHAEVLAIRSVENTDLLPSATLYVNLEPCAHHGRTPPCADLILASGIRRVVIAGRDPYPAVNGKGMERLREGGVEVVEGVLHPEAEWLNRRFLTLHRLDRPHVVLKWAQTADGFMDRIRKPDESPLRITAPETNRLVHLWRSQEQAILVGAGTVGADHPRLTARLAGLRDPIRVVVDRSGVVKSSEPLWEGSTQVIVLTARPEATYPRGIRLVLEDFTPHAWMRALREEGIQSVFIEGGPTLLGLMLKSGIWDEVRILEGPESIGKGIPAPIMEGDPAEIQMSGHDRIRRYHAPRLLPLYRHALHH